MKYPLRIASNSPARPSCLIKVEPFEDDFNDGNATGWTVASGTWQASGNYLEPTHASNWNGIKQSTTDADNEVRLRYRINDTSNGSAALVVRGRYVDDNNLVQVVVRPGSVALEQIASGTPATLDTESAASTQDAWYNLRIESDGADVTVWRWADGELETKVLETASASVTTANAVMLGADAAFAVDFDNVRILADGLSNTTTFAVNNANELTSMTDYNGSTSFGFDAWGRMTSKARGSYAAAYGYRYGQMLCSVDSDFPGEGDVTYEYGGDGKRRSRTADGSSIIMNWASKRYLVSEETAAGALLKTYVPMILADLTGANPAFGTVRYYAHDQLASVRCTFSATKSMLNYFEFAPFGEAMKSQGEESVRQYAGLSWDGSAEMYLSHYRFLSAASSRWIKRDPLGMIDGTNLFAYAKQNPIKYWDPLGGHTGGELIVPSSCNMGSSAYLPEEDWPENTSLPFPESGGGNDSGPSEQRFRLDFYYGPNGTGLKISGCWTCKLACDETGTPVVARCRMRTGGLCGWVSNRRKPAPRGPIPGDGLSPHPYPNGEDAPDEPFPSRVE